MLKGAVRQPVSQGYQSSVLNAADTTMAATEKALTQSLPQQVHPRHQQQGNSPGDEGKEKIIPLIRRPLLQRLDILPFILGYAVLILSDCTLLSVTMSKSRKDRATNDNHHLHNYAVAIDLIFLFMLAGQLVLFLWSQWNPVVKAKVAFRFYSCNFSDESDFETAERKAEDMRTWTHCLIIPPNPYDVNEESPLGSKSGFGNKGRRSTNASLIRPERPGIVPLTLEEAKQSTSSFSKSLQSLVAVVHFRGWTYRCCCNYSFRDGNNEKSERFLDSHTDFPMERIWKLKKSYDLAEISDEDDFHPPGNTSKDSNAVVSSASFWKPHFHRLHFPIDFPLNFYANEWHGHDSLNFTGNSNTLYPTMRVYGTNSTIIPLPPFLSLLIQQLLQPLFLFQLFCVALWSLDEYWIYAVFTLISLFMFECTVAYNRWKGVKRLREEVEGGSDEESNEEDRRKEAQVVECYRGDEWIFVPSHQLIVGDIVSVISPTIHSNSNNPSCYITSQNLNMKKHDHNRGYQISADLLLLKGRAVVNEAMLTGESVPQVKESIGTEVSANDKRNSPLCLDLNDGSAHKRCILFGGTTLVDHHSDNEVENLSQKSICEKIPPPSNQGLVCFVLRTGFDTIQGQLLRTLAYHAESGGNGGGNSGGGEGVNAKETFYFLLLLLICAVASAATVLEEAWGDVTRNHFKLILHVVIIITSVIPPELPMELSLAVTTSLGELIKRSQIYCTEPFRIPLAGLVDTCCFDKTGTLTSDELKLHGVRLPFPGTKQDDCDKKDRDLILFESQDSDKNGDFDVGMVQSLLPRETLRVMIACHSLALTHKFVPGSDGRTIMQTELCGDPLEKAVLEGCQWTLHPKAKVDAVVEKVSLAPISFPSTSNNGSIIIHHRFSFSSKLRRMTVLAQDTFDEKPTLWALTKGAPEALKSMMDPKSLPLDFDQSYLRHMQLGRRVLAMAYRDLGKYSPSALSKWKSCRESVESKLSFAGLLIMDSPLKPDSSRIVKELRAGHQNVVMVTGDAVLTAAEVARRVGIIDSSPDSTYELCETKDYFQCSYQPKFMFRLLGYFPGHGKNDKNESMPYTPANVSEISSMVKQRKVALCITGDVLSKIALSAIQEEFPNSQSSRFIDDRAVLNHPIARAELASIVPIISVFARHAPRHKEAVIAAFNSAGCHTLMCGDGTNDVGALKQAHVGVSIISVPDLEAKQRLANETIDALKAEEKKERKAAKKNHFKKENLSNKSTRTKRSRAERLERSLQALSEADDELAFVSLGNASVASPFTSRKTSVKCCKEILQQGRCTLVTMIQIYKILGVNCLVNALVLTKLHQKGVKQGDRQLTAVGVVVACLFLLVTRGKPLPKLSSQKPPSSVLCKETLLSMSLQFTIHFMAIMAVTYMSDAYTDPYDPSMIPDAQFNPNILNTATFLVTVLSTVNTFVVNYRGWPFMENLNENVVLFRSIQACYFVLFICALDMFPPLNQLLQLSPLPVTGRPEFRPHFPDKMVPDVYRTNEENIIFSLMLQAVDMMGFRITLCAVMLLDTAMVVMAEQTIRSAINNWCY
mmetsp:Transcript_30537/g.61020  ORF Transcript_30537/g.61020 Transcript_30537/m.61020 type:complete len:1555 (+) Transcript_30537:226-4890(+)